MGATGYTVFEDDYGADWSAGFLADPSIEEVRRILSDAKSAKYLDDRQGTAALCCAEIVAAALGKPVQTMSSELGAWAQSVADRLTPMKDAAFSTVDVVKDRSELNEIWAGDPKWTKYLQEVQRRLRKGG